MSHSVDEPYKEDEFEVFIKLIETDQIAHWGEIATVLGVAPNTVTAWKKHPRARAAIAKGISKSLSEMEKVGNKDWRMWEAKLKMLGINPVTKSEVSLPTDPIIKILEAYGIEVTHDREIDGSVQDPSTSTT